MGRFSTMDFASLLDDVIAAGEAREDEPLRRSSIPFDTLATNDDGDGRIADPVAAAEYLFSAAERFGIETETPPIVPDLPSVEPLDIAVELGLTGKESVDVLDRIRRDFAFVNHPDRVSVDLRDRAIARMQIANRMIDDAKRRTQAR